MASSRFRLKGEARFPLTTKLVIEVRSVYNRRIMSELSLDHAASLCQKIARLVEERGWNQEEFARRANLNRLTVRHILQHGSRRLHNATVLACAGALGLTVSDLRQVGLGRLLPRMRLAPPTDAPEDLRRLYEQATQPELLAWLEQHPDQARQLTPLELDELFSLQGTGGPLTSGGLAHFIDRIERKRQVKEQIDAIAGTEYLPLVEQLVGLIYEKIQP